MSRRNARRAQNAGSLIRPSAVVILCQAPMRDDSEIQCGRYGKRCYDLELNHVADYCPEHAAQHGYCRKCGNELTETERRGMTPTFGSGLCGACAAPRAPRYYADGTFDGDWPDEDDEYDRPE